MKSGSWHDQTQMFRCPFFPKRSIWLTSVMLAGSGLMAQSLPDAGGFKVRHWTTDDGLPQNRIACLKQTRDGYLWIGTWFGLARFDGVRFTVFSKINTPVFENEVVNSLAEDKAGKLWVATRDGLLCYQDHKFQRFTAANGLPDRAVFQLAPAIDDGVWFFAGDFVGRFCGGAFRDCWHLPMDGPFEYRALQQRETGELDVFRNWSWFTLGTDHHWLTNSLHPGWIAIASALDPSSVWLGTRDDGLYKVQHGELAPVARELFAGKNVDFIQPDRDGSLWINVRGEGLFHGQGHAWQKIELPSNLLGGVHCLERDQEGTVWVGTDSGLFQLLPRRLKTYTRSDGLPDDNIWSICEDENGAIWLGTDRGLCCLRNGIPEDFTGLETDAATAYHSVWPSRSGGVLVVRKYGGLRDFKDGRFTSLIAPPNIPGMVNAIFADRAGTVWLGTDGGVVNLPAGGQVTNNPSLVKVHSILEDREGGLWFGPRDGGVVHVHRYQTNTFTEADGLSGRSVWAMHEDSEGTLWFGSENGLTRVKAGKFFSFRKVHGLPEGTINCILSDDFGYLWLGELDGISRVSLAELNAVADRRSKKATRITLGVADGMESAETNGESQPSGWKAHDGRLYFPTTRGVVVIDPKNFQSSHRPPQVVIEQVLADDRLVYGDPAISGNVGAPAGLEPQAQPTSTSHNSPAPVRIAPGKANLLEFKYTANTFTDPKRGRFRYRLTGYDANWSEETAERVVHYTNLRPGTYRFEVMAANHHGFWNPIPETFTFSLSPHYWQTWWFYVVVGVSAIGVVASIQTYRLRWQRRLLKLEHQRALAEERTRIARDLHDDLGTALTGLALELDVVGRETAQMPKVNERLGETAARTRDLAERMREVVWTVNPKCDTVSSLASFLEQQIAQFLKSPDMRVRLEFPEDIPSLPLKAETRHQLALTVREALTNVVRHANATQVTLSLAFEGDDLRVQIRDNGCGFSGAPTVGNGLANMRSRMEQVGGHFQCCGQPGVGTTILLDVPIKRKHQRTARQS